MGANWDAAERSLWAVALRYNALYQQRPGPPAAAAARENHDAGPAMAGSALDAQPAVD
jgi:hypothetical protein